MDTASKEKIKAAADQFINAPLSPELKDRLVTLFPEYTEKGSRDFVAVYAKTKEVLSLLERFEAGLGIDSPAFPGINITYAGIFKGIKGVLSRSQEMRDWEPDRMGALESLAEDVKRNPRSNLFFRLADEIGVAGTGAKLLHETANPDLKERFEGDIAEEEVRRIKSTVRSSGDEEVQALAQDASTAGEEDPRIRKLELLAGQLTQFKIHAFNNASEALTLFADCWKHYAPAFAHLCEEIVAANKRPEAGQTQGSATEVKKLLEGGSMPPGERKIEPGDNLPG